MLTFATSLACAGIGLSLIARVPVLLAVLIGTVLAILASGALSALGVTAASSTLGNVLVAIVALQGGYGLGVVARAVTQRVLATRAGNRTGTVPMSPLRSTPIHPEHSPNGRLGD